MGTVLVQEVGFPLFGTSDDRLAVGGLTPTSAVDLDLRHLGHIAEHAGVEAGEDLSQLARFIGGGPTPAALDALGEIIAYLHLLDGGWHPLPALARGEPRFLLQSGGRLGCAEVKTLHAADPVDLAGIDLMLRGRRPVPFPASFGFAQVHLVHDHVGGVLEVILVRLEAQRSQLPIVAFSTAAAAERWRASYEGWSRALWARDPRAAALEEARLVEQTETWLASDAAVESAAALRSGWEAHRAAVEASRSLAEVETVERLEHGLFADRRARKLWAEDPGVSVFADDEVVELRTSASGRPGIDAARATVLVLVRAALEALHRFSVDDVLLIGDLSPVVVKWAGEEQVLGWRASGGPVPSLVALKRRGEQELRFGTPWMMALSVGDPRTALGLHSDGRGYLRFPRELATDQVWTLA